MPSYPFLTFQREARRVGRRARFTAAFRSLRAVFLLLAAVSGTARAQEARLQIEVAPATVVLSAPTAPVKNGKPAQPVQKPSRVWVIVRNPTAQTLSRLRLDWIDLEGTQVKPDRAAVKLPPILPPGQEAAISLEVSQGGEEALSGAIPFRVDYEINKSLRVVSAPLTVKSREPDAVEKIADAQIKTALESLKEHEPGKIYLVLTNKSSAPITVGAITPTGPAFIRFGTMQKTETGGIQPPLVRLPFFRSGSGEKETFAEQQTFTLPFPLAPGQTATVTIDVEARSRVRQGKHLLVFTIPLTWTLGGVPQARSLVVTQSVTVGVFGESEVLTALGVPSFLLLPGFLLVGTMGLLWRWGWLKRADDAGKFPLDLEWKSADFWLIAITLSLAIDSLYSLLWQFDLRDGYGFSDIVNVWLLSLAIAIVAYTLWLRRRNVLLQRAENRRKQQEEQTAQEAEEERRRVEAEWRRRTPAPGDDPITVLEKLALRGIGTTLPRVRLFGHSGPVGYVLVADTESGKILVAPAMEITGDMDVETEASVTEERGKADPSPARLAELLKPAEPGKPPPIAWQPDQDLTGVREVEEDDIFEERAANKIISG